MQTQESWDELKKLFNEFMNNDVIDNEIKEVTNESEDDNVCLITGERLDEYSITMPCNHKFNYLPLYKEICMQKSGVNHREYIRIPYRAMKCPYCRVIHNNILPYRDILGVTKIDSVNSPDKYALLTNTCKYIFKSGNKKGDICNNKCLDRYCKRHEKLAIKSDNKILVEKEKCKYIFSKGVNCGKRCKNNSKNNGYCGIHLKLIH